MKLYVKSIDAPLDCITCIYQEYDEDGFSRCRIDGAYAELNERRKDCPLSEIPTPHGRLIDADAHIQSLKENQCGERCRKNHDCVNCGIGMYIRIVENEPTVIEAEG